MKIIVEIDVSPGFFQDKRRKKPTIRETALNLVSRISESDRNIRSATLNGLVDEGGKQVHEINIDLYGVMRVAGAIAFNESTGVTHTLLVVDEGASYLLFELDGDRALFHGALTGMELDGFESRCPGRKFSYYRRVYKKLSDNHIFALIDPTKIYRYDTGEPFESPRKAVKNTV
jgi:hypothetical protein